MKKLCSILALSLVCAVLFPFFEISAGPPRIFSNDEIEAKLTNPHPPVTENQIERVEFAKLAIEKFLMETPKFFNRKVPKFEDLLTYKTPLIKLKINKECLENDDCWQNNTDVQNYLIELHSHMGRVMRFKNAHLIPWAYNNFVKQNQPATTVKKEGYSASYQEAARAVNSETMMMVPALDRNEYMVHVHAFMANQKWYHLNIILTEDKEGNLLFQRFYFYKVPDHESHALPPGTVC